MLIERLQHYPEKLEACEDMTVRDLVLSESHKYQPSGWMNSGTWWSRDYYHSLEEELNSPAKMVDILLQSGTESWNADRG